MTTMELYQHISYPDGLRGVASFILFMGHYIKENLGKYNKPHRYYEDGAPLSPLQLPSLRVKCSAGPIVHIFFIVSGHILSYKPLKQIHAQQFSALATTLSSSVFRRALRLFLPSFITLFVMAVAVYYDLSDNRYAEAHFSLCSQQKHVLAYMSAACILRGGGQDNAGLRPRVEYGLDRQGQRWA